MLTRNELAFRVYNENNLAKSFGIAKEKIHAKETTVINKKCDADHHWSLHSVGL